MYLIMQYKSQDCNYIEQNITLIGYSDSLYDAQEGMLEHILETMKKYGITQDDYDKGIGYGDMWCIEDDSMSAWLSEATEGYYWEIVELE